MGGIFLRRRRRGRSVEVDQRHLGRRRDVLPRAAASTIPTSSTCCACGSPAGPSSIGCRRSAARALTDLAARGALPLPAAAGVRRQGRGPDISASTRARARGSTSPSSSRCWRTSTSASPASSIEQLAYADFIRRYDRAGTLFYLDPPYWGCETRLWPGRVRPRRLRRGSPRSCARIDGRFMLSINDTPGVRETFAGCSAWSRSRPPTRSRRGPGRRPAS